MVANHLTANEKLDVVLTYLNDENNKFIGKESVIGDNNETEREHKRDYEITKALSQYQLSRKEVFDILAHLIYTDNYITETMAYYSINFRGKYFIENGGYVGHQKMIEANEKWQKKHDTRTFWATFLAGMFAGVYLIWEVVKYLLDRCYYDKP